MAARNSPYRSIAAVFSGNLSASILGAMGGVLAARFIGPEPTGQFRAYGIVLTYLTFLHLGTFDGLWRQLPFYFGKDRAERAKQLASAGGAWNLLVSAAASAAFACCAIWRLARHDVPGFWGWLAQASSAWAIFYGGYLSATYRTFHEFTALARIVTLQAVVAFALVFTIPPFGFYGLCLRAAIPPLVGVVLFQLSRPMKVRYHLDRHALAELVRIGLPFMGWGGLYSFVWTATESALILSLGGVTALGLYAAAVAIREAMNVLPMAAYHVLMPQVVETYAREASVRAAHARSVKPTIMLTAIVGAGALAATWLLGVMVPHVIPKYVAALPIMRASLWFSVLHAAGLPVNTLVATGRSWTVGRGVLIGFFVFPIAAWLLTPALGGALAVVVGSLLGRAARTVTAYVEIALLTRGERAASVAVEG